MLCNLVLHANVSSSALICVTVTADVRSAEHLVVLILQGRLSRVQFSLLAQCHDTGFVSVSLSLLA